MNLLTSSNKNSYILISIIVLIGFHVTYGLQLLLPNNINWLMAAYHDWGQHYLGWAFYKSEPWSFPIGQIQNYHYPSGSNIGFTDSIPLLAIPLKIFADIFNEDFQYFGLFLLSSHLLMAIFSFKLFTFYKVPKSAAIIGSILLAFNPVILYRAMHPALTAQWLIIASLYLYIISMNKNNVIRLIYYQLLLLLISSLITPYLFAIVFGFSIVLLAKLYLVDKSISLKSVLINLGLTIILPLAVWYVVGMIGFSGETSLAVSNSYGLYAWNLNGFINSKGYSLFLSELPHLTVHQYEGYSYLGLGVLLLIIIILVSIIAKQSYNSINKLFDKSFYPLLIYVFVITAFAISPKVSWGSTLLFELPTPPLISEVGEIFRASSRFIWILYYGIIISLIIVFFRLKLNSYLKLTILLLIIMVQFYDTKALFMRYNFNAGSYKIEKLNQSKWNHVLPNFNLIITYPPFQNKLLYNSDYQDLCFLAKKNNLPITMGYVARKPAITDKQFTDSLKESISKGYAFDSTLYITTSEHILDFGNLVQKEELAIGLLDGYYLLYPKKDIDECMSQELQEKVSLVSSLKDVYKIEHPKKINLPIMSPNALRYNVENYNQLDDIIKFKGWAVKEGEIDSSIDSLFLIFFNPNESYEFPLTVELRPDVTKHFKAKDLSRSGFNAILSTQTLAKGNYQVAIKIKSEGNSEEVMKLDRIGDINID